MRLETISELLGLNTRLLKYASTPCITYVKDAMTKQQVTILVLDLIFHVCCLQPVLRYFKANFVVVCS